MRLNANVKNLWISNQKRMISNEHNKCPFIYNEGSGKVKNTPVVFLHGFLGSKLSWRYSCENLSRKFGFKCYSLDSRHHGDWICKGDIDYITMSDDVKDFLVDKKLDSVHLVGHSMGGKTAMTFSQMYPEMLKSLSVIDIAPIYSHQCKDIVDLIDAMVFIDPSGMTRDEIHSNLSRKIKNKLMIFTLLKNLKTDEHGKLYWGPDSKCLRNSLENIFSFPELDKNYKGPVLFIIGGKSNIVQKSDYPSIRELYPQVQMEIIPNIGHYVHVDAPERMTEILVEFLNKN